MDYIYESTKEGYIFIICEFLGGKYEGNSNQKNY